MLWIDECSPVVVAHKYRELGILPHSGGWAEQPAVLMQLVDVFKSEAGRG